LKYLQKAHVWGLKCITWVDDRKKAPLMSPAKWFCAFHGCYLHPVLYLCFMGITLANTAR